MSDTESVGQLGSSRAKLPDTVIVSIAMPVEDYLGRTDVYKTAEIVAVEHGGRWLGGGTDMTTSMSDISYVMSDEASATALVDALKAVGLGAKLERF